MKNKFLVILGFFIMVMLGLAAGKLPKTGPENLKVLPKDISPANLDSIMSGYCKALGVGCDFCHAKNKTNNIELDFVSDDKPEKEIARHMMRMTEMINKDFFNYKITYTADELMAVACLTCHQGNPRPELKKE
jgi:hypothetical protein